MIVEAAGRFEPRLAQWEARVITLIVMSTSEILAQLHRLTPAERDLVRSRLDDLEAAAPLSPQEQKIVDERVAAYRAKPDATLSWAVAEADIRKELGLE